jgi:hypothetical protein
MVEESKGPTNINPEKEEDIREVPVLVKLTPTVTFEMQASAGLIK